MRYSLSMLVFFRSSETIECVNRDGKVPVKRERLTILYVADEKELKDVEMNLRRVAGIVTIRIRAFSNMSKDFWDGGWQKIVSRAYL